MTARKALPTVQEIVGLVCPQCGRDDELWMVLSMWCNLTPKGIRPALNDAFVWTDLSAIRCGSCGCHGTAIQFTASPHAERDGGNDDKS